MNYEILNESLEYNVVLYERPQGIEPLMNAPIREKETSMGVTYYNSQGQQVDHPDSSWGKYKTSETTWTAYSLVEEEEEKIPEKRFKVEK